MNLCCDRYIKSLRKRKLGSSVISMLFYLDSFSSGGWRFYRGKSTWKKKIKAIHFEMDKLSTQSSDNILVMASWTLIFFLLEMVIWYDRKTCTSWSLPLDQRSHKQMPCDFRRDSSGTMQRVFCSFRSIIVYPR